MSPNVGCGDRACKSRRACRFFVDSTRVAAPRARTYFQVMHELALAESLFDLVVEKTETSKVRRIRIEVGRSLAVVPDALRFCFEIVSKGSSLEDATLDILEIPISGRCSGCGWEGSVEGSLPLCPRCSCAVELRSGGELRVRDVEVI